MDTNAIQNDLFLRPNWLPKYIIPEAIEWIKILDIELRIVTYNVNFSFCSFVIPIDCN